ncbi:Ypt/Rab-GAP of gyp1p [Glarea lozoyensis ATCC 20868]|uniref:Ypt/Rab-GAP of gyp1p n=1 Tax=Glarea lozoyensis (strain ATCC 20868 / MF5171) TaxID=1116229 RepID=S3DE52_GLAL2|nr:Ypt/Rab-GAP of gyp1p [Glarea lozoyensis ATCC 20868]EPE36697.1 Ypt/Rab-GAP of gyp1p [Glarea lozoyensis ATCC 20868]
MSLAYGVNGVDSSGHLDAEHLHVRRQRSQQNSQFSLYPGKPLARPPTAPNRSTPPSPISPSFFANNRPHRQDSLPNSDPRAYHQRPSTSHTPSREAPRSINSSPQTQSSSPNPYPLQSNHGLHKKPSEASRLRALNNGYRSQSQEGRKTPEGVANFSRPRTPSIKRTGRNGSPRATQQGVSTFSGSQYNEHGTLNEASPPRHRGLSASSSRSIASNLPSVPLRPAASIPDYQAAESIYTRQRNLNNSAYRPGRVMSRPDSNYSAHRRDPMFRSAANDNEEVRASFRSALTTNSSFMGTIGTERSSIMTKSSSATSIYGKDEGMSVDDAIGMYEGGFQDSGTDEPYLRRRMSVESQQRGRGLRSDESGNDSLNVPTGPLIRDSLAMFRASTIDASPDESSEKPKTLDVQGSYFTPQPPSRPATRAAPTTWDDTRDRYGFRKNTQHVPVAQFEAWNGPYNEHLARRRKKWVALLRSDNLSTDHPETFPAKSVKVKRFVRKGIPPDWRGAAWFFYAGGPAMLEKHPGVYADLLQKAHNGEVSETDNEIIERDLNRTFPDNIKFKPDPIPGEIAPDAETPILQSLRNVLQAFSIYNPKIGYCQSLNFLAGLLLLFMDEEKSFWMLNVITRVYLPGTHELNLEGANVDLGVLMIAIKDMMPGVWAKIGGELDGTAGNGRVSMRLPPITLCTTAWFMSCFIGTLPIESTLRVWDSFFYEGSKTLFRIALTIFKLGEAEIKAVTDPMEIFQVVQTIPRRLIDANVLLEACFKRRNGFGHLSQETIERGRAQRRQGYADERAKAAGEIATTNVIRKKTLLGRKERQ